VRNVWMVLAMIALVGVIGSTVATARAGTVSGLVIVQSAYSVDETANRLQGALQAGGLMVVARVDHAANAQRVGKVLRPTQLLIFGNPQAGTELLQAVQTVGIDLPQKLLVWEDEAGQVHVAYNDPGYLAQRHGIVGEDQTLMMIGNALSRLVMGATTRG